MTTHRRLAIIADAMLAALVLLALFLRNMGWIPSYSWVTPALWALAVLAIIAIVLLALGQLAWRFVAWVSMGAMAFVMALSVLGAFGIPSIQAEPSGDPTVDLTIPRDYFVPAEARCSDSTFRGESLMPVGGGENERRFADALALPFRASGANEALQELFATHCTEPSVLDATAQALLSDRFRPGGADMGDLNPWLREIVARATDQHRIEYDSWLALFQDGEAVLVTAEYQEYAALTNSLLLKLANYGYISEVDGLLTVAHWPSYGIIEGALPRAHRVDNGNDNLPALVLAYSEKGSGESRCAVTAIGWNRLDKRPMFFDCKPVERTIAERQPATQPRARGVIGTQPKVTKTTFPKTTPPRTTPPKTTPPKTTPPKTTPPKTTPPPTGPTKAPAPAKPSSRPADNPPNPQDASPSPQAAPLQPSTSGGAAPSDGHTSGVTNEGGSNNNGSAPSK